ncbi:hypothetical protein C0995_005600 [Termitomyces sp. Mi166|nr:hypothetical protein C0995_005600 [Termitomyces sp. Mi166\
MAAYRPPLRPNPQNILVPAGVFEEFDLASALNAVDGDPLGLPAPPELFELSKMPGWP